MPSCSSQSREQKQLEAGEAAAEARWRERLDRAQAGEARMAGRLLGCCAGEQSNLITQGLSPPCPSYPECLGAWSHGVRGIYLT